MKILVTGCAGFIGSRVTNLLLRDGHTVIGLDNLNDAYDNRLKYWRLKSLEDIDGFQFHHLDITDYTALQKLFHDNHLDAVINLAARAGVQQSVVNPWVYIETNTTGTLNLLEICRHQRIEKFILASTSSLYGAHNPRPFREDADTSLPLSPYAASKKGAEALCYTYHYLYGIDITILRYFTVYGPAGRPDMSIFRFIRWITEGESVHLYGDGNQERDFTFVEDIARGTHLALKPLGYDVINLGSDRPIKLYDVILMLEHYLGSKAIIKREPTAIADVPATWADITKAQKLLDWQPMVSLEDGLRQACNWYLDNRTWAREIRL